jgi:hypothetical protein
MNLEQMVQRFEARLAELGQRLLGASPEEQAREEMVLLAAELAERRAALARAQEERDATLRRLNENQQAAALLPSEIESSLRRGKRSQAFRQALELDRLRKSLDADRVALPRLEQTCWSLRFHLRQLERRLARVREETPAR